MPKAPRQKKPPKPTLKMQLLAANDEIATLRKDNRAVEKSRDDWAEVAERRRKHIQTFKQEHLDLLLAGAELRGYIQRTLEDDAVREAGPVVKAPDISEREVMERMHNRMRPQPDEPRRTGPSAMHPVRIVRAEASTFDESLFRLSRVATQAPEPPVAWQDRQ